jgi:hypothetical protein
MSDASILNWLAVVGPCFVGRGTRVTAMHYRQDFENIGLWARHLGSRTLRNTTFRNKCWPDVVLPPWTASHILQDFSFSRRWRCWGSFGLWRRVDSSTWRHNIYILLLRTAPEKTTVTQFLKNSPPVMDADGLLATSQDHAIRPYP